MGTTVKTANGTFISNTPLTTSITDENAPGLLLNEIDRRVTLIRPMATPIDQISRSAGARKCGSMKVDYYSVDTKPDATVLASEVTTGAVGSTVTWTLKPKDPIFEESETILCPTSLSTKTECVDQPIILYVMSVNETTGELTAVPINAADGDELNMETGAKLVRMGRAATELDVQTAQFEVLPRKEQNFCQIFKMQVEQSTYQKIANKEVGWSFSDQEEAAIMDMRLGMEKNFLFGRKLSLYNPRKREDVMFTGGIWYQAGKDFTFGSQALTHSALIDMMKEAFTGNAGSKRKILIAGSEFVAKLSKMQFTKDISGGDVFTRWGIDFDEIRSKFGTLLVRHSEVFDSCGYADKGLVIDPEYLTKYSHVPFSTERLDLRGSGQRNTDAVVVTEASCLVLRYPNAHMRVSL